MLDQALGLFQHHLGDLHMARSRFVEGRADHFATHGAGHVGHFFRTLIDQQNDQIDFRMVLGDGMGDILQHHRLAGARRRHDQGALALAERRDQVDDAGGQVLARLFDLEAQALIGIKRGQIVEIDAVTDIVRRLEIDGVDLQQREIALAILGRADLAFHRVAGTQAEAAHLAGGDIDIVRTRQVIRFRRSQETKSILQDLKNAVAIDRRIVVG